MRRLFTATKLSPYVIGTACKVGGQAVSFVVMLAVIQHFSASIFGTFSIAWAVATICNTTLYSGFFQHLLRVTDIESEKHTTFWLLLLEGALMTALMALAGLLLRKFGQGSVAQCFLVLAPVPLFVSVGAWHDALMVRNNRVALTSLLNFLCELVGAAALVGAANYGWTTSALVAWRMSVAVLGVAALLLVSGEAPRLKFDRAHAKSAWLSAQSLQGSGSLSIASAYAGDFILAAFLNPSAAGAYRVGTRVSVLGSSMLLEPLKPLTWGTFAAHERAGAQAGISSAFLDQLRLASFVCWPVLTAISLFSSTLFALSPTRGWEAAAPILTFLAIARMPDVFLHFLDPALVCGANDRVRLKVRTLSTAALLVGIAATGLLSAKAVALWQIVHATLFGGIAMAYVCRTFKIDATALAVAVLPGAGTALICYCVGAATFQLTTGSDLGRAITAVSAVAVMFVSVFVALLHWGKLRLPTGEHQHRR